MSEHGQHFVEVEGHTIPLTNLGKVFWPADGYTKADIMQYYNAVWPVIAPHLRDRPLSLVRYPEGITGDHFYQKNFPDAPEWVERVPLHSEKRVVHYCMCNNLSTLLWSVNMGCIEVHPWLSRIRDLRHPTYVIFDLDPMEPASFGDAVHVARALKVLLDQLNLQAFPKISGATGLHLYLPVTPKYSFRTTSLFVKALADMVIRAMPDHATNERAIKDRGGRVYIDHLQNLQGKTIASVYSLRPFPGAPVSMPVQWEELDGVSPGAFTLANAADRVRKAGDLFGPLFSLQQSLDSALQLLGVTPYRAPGNA